MSLRPRPAPTAEQLACMDEGDMYRAGGDVICRECGKLYYDHPHFAEPYEFLKSSAMGTCEAMSGRNSVISLRNPFVNCYFDKDQFCGSNGQCIMFECREWIDGEPYYPELVRDDISGFAICPRCGVS